jgi:branched-chain amino acid transport system permease protein
MLEDGLSYPIRGDWIGRIVIGGILGLLSVLLLPAFVIVVLGGLGSLPGALAGGLIIGLVQTYASFYISSSAAFAVLYIGVLVILLLKPTGLFGVAEADAI